VSASSKQQEEKETKNGWENRGRKKTKKRRLPFKKEMLQLEASTRNFG